MEYFIFFIFILANLFFAPGLGFSIVFLGSLYIFSTLALTILRERDALTDWEDIR